MSDNEDLELQALQRQLDDAFETTRPRAGYEDECAKRKIDLHGGLVDCGRHCTSHPRGHRNSQEAQRGHHRLPENLRTDGAPLPSVLANISLYLSSRPANSLRTKANRLPSGEKPTVLQTLSKTLTGSPPMTDTR